ncbi:MAG: hypothetical protein PHE73_09180 [Sulfurovaceae bacterium]|nr:hypothetical protein [Sulfurovaceae bacterium]
MNLSDANEQLKKAYEDYAVITKELQKLEFQYETRYNELYIHSGMGTAPLKEAEVKNVLTTEGIYEKVLEARSTAKIAYYKLQTYQEYCRNLRFLLSNNNS